MTPAQISTILAHLDGVKDEVQSLKEAFETHRREEREDRQRHDRRIGKLEGWRERMKGALAVVGVVGPVVSGILVYVLTRPIG